MGYFSSGALVFIFPGVIAIENKYNIMRIKRKVITFNIKTFLDKEISRPRYHITYTRLRNKWVLMSVVNF